MFNRLVWLSVCILALSACDAGKTPAVAATPAAAPAADTSARHWELGSDYMLIDPRVPTSTDNKIEVVEVFSYACPHCAHFQPFVEELKSKLPADAEFVLIPAVFSEQWEPTARAFYTAKAMGILDKTHQALFDAIHTQHLPLVSIESLASNFYANYGVSDKAFLSTANSFVIDSQLARGVQLAHDYGVDSTPTLIVNGKYRVTMSAEKKIGPKDAVDIALFLVKQEEAQAKAAK